VNIKGRKAVESAKVCFGAMLETNSGTDGPDPNSARAHSHAVGRPATRRSLHDHNLGHISPSPNFRISRASLTEERSTC